MDKRCTVCTHSQAHDINLALLAGATLDTLKQQFGLSRSALHRHKLHLQKALDKAEDKMRHNVILSYLFQLNDYNGAAAATVAEARAEGNKRLTLQAVNSGARIINAMAKFEVDLDHETIYRLMTSPEYVQSGCLLPGDPQILAGPRQSLVKSLAAACPVPELSDQFDPEDVAAYLNLAQEPEANTHLPQSRQLEFPGFLAPLADVLPAPALEIQRDRQEEQEAGQSSFLAFNQKPKTENRKPSFKRDGSGTEAGQTAPCAKESLQIQKVKQEDKISETTTATTRQTANSPVPPQTLDPCPLAPDPCLSDQRPQTPDHSLAAPDPVLQAFPLLRPKLSPELRTQNLFPTTRRIASSPSKTNAPPGAASSNGKRSLFPFSFSLSNAKMYEKENLNV